MRCVQLERAQGGVPEACVLCGALPERFFFFMLLVLFVYNSDVYEHG